MTCQIGAFLSSTVFLQDNLSSLVFCICAADVLNSAMAPEMGEQLGPPQLRPLSGATCILFSHDAQRVGPHYFFIVHYAVLRDVL